MTKKDYSEIYALIKKRRAEEPDNKREYTVDEILKAFEVMDSLKGRGGLLEYIAVQEASEHKEPSELLEAEKRGYEKALKESRYEALKECMEENGYTEEQIQDIFYPADGDE